MTGRRLKADVFRLSHPYLYTGYIPAIHTVHFWQCYYRVIYTDIILLCAATVQGAGRVYYIPTEEKKPETKLNNTAAALYVCVSYTQFRPERKSSRDHSWCYYYYISTIHIGYLTCGTYGWLLPRLC